MKERILLLSMNYKPEEVGTGKYSGELVDWIRTKSEADIKIIAAVPHFPSWSIHSPYINRSQRDIYDKDVYRVAMYIPKKLNNFKRLLALITLAFNSFKFARMAINYKPTHIILVEPSLALLPIYFFVKLMCKSKGILHIQDYEIQALFASFRFQSMKRLAAHLQNWVNNRFDLVSTISNKMLERVKVNNKLLVQNWTSISNKKTLDFPQNHSDEKVRCLYSGSIGKKQGLEILIQVATQLPKISFQVNGEGPGKKILESNVQDNGITNIEFGGFVPEDELQDFLARYQIHLVIQKSSFADLVLPSKLTNLMATGSVVIVTAEQNTELSAIAKKWDCFELVEPENPDLLTSVIKSLSVSADRRAQISKNAKLYAASELQIDNILNRFLTRIMKL